MGLSQYQSDFIDFLLASEVLLFGDFVTKSGRKTPYFINTGKFDNGAKIDRIGSFYAQHMVTNGMTDITSVFGPAYKGIPLAVATAASLSRDHGKSIGFTFDRKEAKTHGDKGRMVGLSLAPGDTVAIVEDVITAGTTLREMVPILQESYEVEINGVVIAVDRCERGAGKIKATEQVRADLGVEVLPIVTIHDIIAYLSEPNSSGYQLEGTQRDRIDAYLEEFGA